MNKKIPLGLTITFVAIGCAITFLLTTNFSLGIFNNSVHDIKQRAEIYDKIDNIDTFVRKNYINDVDHEKLLDAIARGYITSLGDKYAEYLTAEENKAVRKQNDGYNVGVGLTLKQDESGYLYISDVTDNSPASEIEIKAGDLIVAIDGTDLLKISFEEASSKLRGEAGTSLKLSIRSNGVDRDVTLTRKEMEIHSVSSHMIEDIGYIKITQFNSKTYQQFKDSVNAMVSAGAKGLVFDLRNNGGGLLDPTLQMLDFLLPEGDIATALYKDGKTKVLGKSDASEIDLPMVAVVNSETASAAELFSSALRDFGKAKLVGEKTYGKGVMQNTYDLPDGSSIKFTIAKFQTSKTPNFDGVGLSPNYEVALENDTEADLKALDEKSDPQLKKALEILSAT